MSRTSRLKVVVLTFVIVWFLIVIVFYGLIPSSNGKGFGRAGSVSKSSSQPAMRLAVLVPFRDRFYELSHFLPHVSSFLRRQNIEHQIFIIHQVDSYRFNRGALINAGFLESVSSCDYFAIHDVDLLPTNDNISYSYPLNGPMHLTPPDLHPKYHYRTFLGGVLLLTHSQFRLADGMSNIFWGWGREDDEFRLRLLDKGMRIHKPQGITTGYKTFLHLHNSVQHPRDMALSFNQRDLTYHRDVVTGVSTLRYELLKRYRLVIENTSATVLDIALHCDLEWTPYCQHTSGR